jgi:hypothetical protein
MRIRYQERPMRKTFALSLAFILVWPLLLVPGQAEKVALRFGPTAGTALTYSINGQVNVSGKDFLNRDLTLDADAQGDMRLAVISLARDSVLAGLSTSGINVRAQLPDRSQSQTLRTEEGKTLEVVFNPSGKVMDIRNPEVLGQQNVLNFSIPQILRDYFPAFPAQPVGPGDQWRETRRLTVPYQGLEVHIDLAIEYTLNDVLPSPDGRKAFVSAVYTVGVSGSRDLGDSMGVFEGRGAGTGNLSFLVDRGYFTEYRLDLRTDAEFVAKKGNKRVLGMPFSFSLLAEVNLVSNTRP